MHPCRAKSSKAASGGILILFLFSVSPVFGKTINVTNTNDSGAGSLRDTIGSASKGDRLTSALTISLPSGFSARGRSAQS